LPFSSFISVSPFYKNGNDRFTSALKNRFQGDEDRRVGRGRLRVPRWLKDLLDCFEGRLQGRLGYLQRIVATGRTLRS
jgi:hypothetical protein